MMLVMLGLALPVWAEGTLTHMSGSVTVQKLDGTTVPGVQGAKVQPGETVVTGVKGYVRMEMPDGAEMVLRPDSQIKIDAYKFVKDKPEEDSSVFSMIKGGLRKVTGLIGKRGNQDADRLKTTTATIGIRGTQFNLRICQGNCGALADGTYVAVRFGAIQTSNQQGSMIVPAGQVVHVPYQRPPVILPRNPGIGFTLPAVIPKLDEKKKQEQQQATQQAASQAASEKPKPAALDQQKPADEPATEEQKSVQDKSGDQQGKEAKPDKGASSGGDRETPQNSQGGYPQVSFGSEQKPNAVQCSVE